MYATDWLSRCRGWRRAPDGYPSRALQLAARAAGDGAIHRVTIARPGPYLRQSRGRAGGVKAGAVTQTERERAEKRGHRWGRGQTSGGQWLRRQQKGLTTECEPLCIPLLIVGQLLRLTPTVYSRSVEQCFYRKRLSGMQ